MQTPHQYKLVEIEKPQTTGFMVLVLEDFVKIFEKTEQPFLLYFTSRPPQTDTLPDHYYTFQFQGTQYTFVAGKFKSFKDLYDARQFDLKQIYVKLHGNANRRESELASLYYGFKESGCYPDFALWTEMHEYGFGFPLTLNTPIPSKDNFEAAKQRGFLKFGESARHHWKKMKTLQFLSGLEEYELYLALTKDIGRDLDERAFNQIWGEGITLQNYSEFRNEFERGIPLNRIMRKIKRIKERQLAKERVELERKREAREFLDLIKKKLSIFESAWEEAQSHGEQANYEVFIQQAYTAIENGVAALYHWEFKKEAPPDTLLEHLTDALREKDYALPERMEVSYWRRLRNNIIHEHARVAEKDGKAALLFFKEVTRQIQRLKMTALEMK